MNKRLIIFLIIALIAVAGYFSFQSQKEAMLPEPAATLPSPAPADGVPEDLQNDLDAAAVEDLNKTFEEIDTDLRNF